MIRSFLIQVSMNFNSSLYSNGLAGISDKFGVSLQGARLGAALFLVAYACEHATDVNPSAG